MSDEFVIDVSTPRQPEARTFFDPLEQEAEVFKSYGGLSPYTRRKISKAASADTTSAETRYYQNTGYGLLNVAEPPYNFDELASFYDGSPTNHAAVVTKVSSVVGLGYGFDTTPVAMDKLQSAKGEAADKISKKIERVKVDVKRWINSLNDNENLQQILEKAATDLEVYGNCYIEVGRTVGGQIGYIGHVPASTIRVRNKRDGFVQVVGQFVTFFRNFGEDVSSPVTNDPRPNELIHIKKYSPKSSFYGVPDSVSAATAIVGDSLASQYNVKYFDNSATPRYIVTLSGGRLSATSEQKLFKFLQSSLRGNPHRTLFMPLPNDPQGNAVKLEMHRVDDSTTDGSWEQYRERNKQDILLAHGVPLTRVGGANGSGIADGLSSDRMFKEQIVVPTQSVFELAINKIVKEKTDVVLFNLNELALTDENAQSQILERYLRNKAMKINEARARIGLPAVPEGDVFFEASPQTMAEQNAQANGTRERDRTRVNENSDSSTTTLGRNPKGAGPKE